MRNIVRLDLWIGTDGDFSFSTRYDGEHLVKDESDIHHYFFYFENSESMSKAVLNVFKSFEKDIKSTFSGRGSIKEGYSSLLLGVINAIEDFLKYRNISVNQEYSDRWSNYLLEFEIKFLKENCRTLMNSGESILILDEV